MSPQSPAASPTPAFAGPGHLLLGGQVTIRLSGGKTVTSDDLLLPIEGSSTKDILSYAAALTLAGDYFAGTTLWSRKRAISDPDEDGTALFCDRVESLRTQATGPLGQDDAAFAVLQAISDQVRFVQQAKDRWGPNNSWMAYLQSMRSLGQDSDELMADYYDTNVFPAILGADELGVSYYEIAAYNLDHFGTDAQLAYRIGHRKAMELAAVATTDADLEQAYLHNAYADHFLTDLFSTGHLRTPRRELRDGFRVPIQRSLISKHMHDEDSAMGLTVENSKRERWTAFGDLRGYDEANAHNIERARQAVQFSVDEVFAAFESRRVPPSTVLDHAPDPVRTRAIQTNHPPMFSVSGDNVYVRDPVEDLHATGKKEITTANFLAVFHQSNLTPPFDMDWRRIDAPKGSRAKHGGPALTAWRGRLWIAFNYDRSGGSIDNDIGFGWWTEVEGWSRLLLMPDHDGQRNTKKAAPAMTVFQDRLYVAWTRKDGAAISYRWTDKSDASGWSHQNTIGYAVNHGGPALAVFQGQLYAAWCHTNNEVRVASSGNGHNWAMPAVIPGSKTNKTSPALATYGGRLWAAWYNNNDELRFSTLDPEPGSQWSRPERVEASLGRDCEHAGPYLAAYGDALHFVWLWGRNDAAYARLKEYDDGDGGIARSWSGAVLMAMEDIQDTRPALAAFGNQLAGAWCKRFNSNYEVETTLGRPVTG